jgi:hypothetical protein
MSTDRTPGKPRRHPHLTAVAEAVASGVGRAAGALSSGLSHFHSTQGPAIRGFFRRRRHAARLLGIGVVIILILEVFCFNASFWKGLTAPAALDPLSTTQQVGSGLRQESTTLLSVVDGQNSWVEIGGMDTVVDTVHLSSAVPAVPDQSAENPPTIPDASALPAASSWVQVRVQVLPKNSDTWVTGPLQGYSPWVANSQYLAAPRTGTAVRAVRVWFQQPVGSTFVYGRVGINERPGFVFSWLRVGLLVGVLLFLIVFVDPHSAVWRMPYDPSSRRWQIAVMALLWLPFAIGLILLASSARPASLQMPTPGAAGNYTYEGDQYARTADAILHGHPWLDLPVVPELAKARNPYSLALRAQLLSQGVTPIFWDHVFWGGHWYMYFGVLPVILLYLPYELVCLAATGSPQGLSTPVAVMLLVTLFVLCALLLLDRVLRRWLPTTSLGTAWLAGLMLIVGGNAVFLLFRPDFYTVPLANSLWMTMLGLLLWLDARRVVTGTRVTHVLHHTKQTTRAWSVTDGNAGWLLQAGQIRLSRPRLVLGTVLLAANLGSRPTFALTVLLAFPIFATEIRHGLFFSCLNRPLLRRTRARGRYLVQTGKMGVKEAKKRARKIIFSSLPNDLCVIATGLVTILPFLGWNYWRFGSLFDFGNRYQLTVTDLTNYREPLDLMPRIALYYLFSPLKTSSDFPWLSLVPTPLRTWQYTEPWMGGLFALLPFCALGLFALLLTRRLARRGAAGFVWTLLVMGVALCLFNSYYAGLSLRYMADFGWIFALLAVLGTAALEQWALYAPGSSHEQAVRLGVVHVLEAVLVLTGLIITLQALFVPGRVSGLLENASTFFFSVRSQIVPLP